MIVTRLEVHDWRNYTDAAIELRAGANLLIGRNGHGKTNLVEAIVYLSTLGSHRVSDDRAMIRAGADAGIVRARLAHGDRAVAVEAQLNRNAANRAQLGGAPIKPRELPRHVSSVIFAPEDLALVRGEPGGRRRFLDQLLVQSAPRFAGVISDYERVLRQRTALLKSARATRTTGELPTLDLWDDKLVTLGTELIVARAELVERMRPPVASAYRDIAGDDHVADLALRLSVDGASLDDDPALDPVFARNRPVDGPELGGFGQTPEAEGVAERFRAALAAARRSELERGVSLVGPHRDDLVLTLNGLPARGYASHGESWSFALALKLASAQVLREHAPLGDPVLILDDVFAELDSGRRGRLAAAIAGYEQVIVTAAVEQDVPEGLTGNVVRIQSGRVVEAGGEA